MEHLTENTKMAAGACRAALPLFAFLAVMLAFAASAHGEGRFVYESCDPTLPGGNPPAAEFSAEQLFSHQPDPAYESFQTCATPDGSIGIGQKGGKPGPSLAWLSIRIQSTPGGWVESLAMTARAGNYHGSNEGSVIDKSWPPPGSGDNPRYFLRRAQPPTPPELGGTRFLTFLSCIMSCEPGAYISTHFIAATEVDPTPPVITAVEGSLVGGDVLRGHQTLRAQAADVGGGLMSMELKINGVVVPGTAIGACSVAPVENLSYKGLAAISPTPCPPSLSGMWDLDTAAPPLQNGPNTVQVCASDFATIGTPNTTCSTSQTVAVDNTCTESPVAGGADLSAGFGDTGSDELTVRFGSGTEIKGGLTNQAGGPIAGATICLESQPPGSATTARAVGAATTDDQGNFAMEVKPGTNRRLLVGYRHDSFQIAKMLSLRTRARPTLKLGVHKLRGGNRVKITGKLPNPDPGGHVLVLQGSSAKGDKWLTFKKVTTGPKGTYRTTYTFTKPRRPTTFRVRAVAPAQAGYEYVAGASKAARIRVRP